MNPNIFRARKDPHKSIISVRKIETEAKKRVQMDRLFSSVGYLVGMDSVFRKIYVSTDEATHVCDSVQNHCPEMNQVTHGEEGSPQINFLLQCK